MNPRDNMAELMAIGAEVFHGRVTGMDANGNYHGVGRNGEKFAGAITARPYGLRSYAPANTGLVATYSQAGLLVLSNENALPSGVSEPEEGETILYNSQGAQVKLDKNGDIIIQQKSSSQGVKLGSSTSGQKSVVRHGDNTLSGDKFDVWAAAVESGIPTGTPPPTSWGTGGVVGTAAATSTEVTAK